MIDRLNAAAATLEAMKWTFDGKVWQPPTDQHGNSLFRIVGFMEHLLRERFDQCADIAHADAGAAHVVDQLGPLLASWDQVKPSDLDTDDRTAT